MIFFSDGGTSAMQQLFIEHDDIYPVYMYICIYAFVISGKILFRDILLFSCSSTVMCATAAFSSNSTALLFCHLMMLLPLLLHLVHKDSNIS